MGYATIESLIEPLSEPTALVLVDMQKGYLLKETPLSSGAIGLDFTAARATTERVYSFAPLARNRGIPVIWTRFKEAIGYTPRNLELKLQADIPDITNPTTEWYDYLREPPEGDPQFVRNVPSVFGGPELEAYLQSQGVKTLIFIGSFTQVALSAAEAVTRGFHSIIPQNLVITLPQFEDERPGFFKTLGRVECHLPYLGDYITSVWDRASKSRAVAESE